MKFTEENIKNLLEDAIKNERIKIYYQPKFDSLTSSIVGAEALSRWLDDDGNIISPIEFIPILEKTEYIVDLDWYVLEQVCKFQQGLLNSNIPVVAISVNFSRIHTKEADFVKKLTSIIEKYSISHDLIEIEITESALARDGNVIIDFISNIRKAGFDVSIDDFGSGLSSLSFVKDVPANILKIDKSLLNNNCENEKERIVLESIFDFAHRLNLKTVAEGVETKEQLGFLRTCDCTMIQGFIFSKPVEENIFTELLLTVDTHRNYRQIMQTEQMSTKVKYLLQDVVFKRFFHISLSNISRDSFYLLSSLNKDAIGLKQSLSSGTNSEAIYYFSKIVHPDDKETFLKIFNQEYYKKCYAEKKEYITLKFRIYTKDGIYVPVENRSYFVTDPNLNEILLISMTEFI